MSTKIATRKSPEDRRAEAEALQASIAVQVEQLRTSQAWVQFLDFSRAFHRYLSGGEGIFERREFSPTCANPAIEMLWAQSGAYIAVGTLAGVSDLDAAT